MRYVKPHKHKLPRKPYALDGHIGIYHWVDTRRKRILKWYAWHGGVSGVYGWRRLIDYYIPF